MNAKRNYQKELDTVIRGLGQEVPSLLLHSCCAPCSSYVLEYLSAWFDITVFYYNPNITEQAEYELRIREVERLISEMQTVHPVRLIAGPYEPGVFLDAVSGLQEEPEGGRRCSVCFALRLRKTAELAKKEGFDYFTTTLSISPLKDAERLNTIGEALAEQYGIAFLPSDFKKRDGYKRSIELSKEYGLYRQDYCGCVYSRKESEERRMKHAEEV